MGKASDFVYPMATAAGSSLKQQNELIINSSYLRDRITELGIKQWWLAEQVGVDKKTVARWIQGKVRSIQPENAKALAEVLACQISDLCHSDEASQLATSEDQRNAALLLQTSSLIEKLGPIGEWNVIESLLRATIVPNLPLQVLGDLYNQLTVASWRQSKLDQAETFNKKALEIANKLGDKTILAAALLSKANLQSWAGQLEDSIRTYRECLALKDFIQVKTLGAIYSNLGAVLFEIGDLQSGLQFQEQASEQFHIHGTATNLSISYTNKTMIFLEMGDVFAADQSNRKADEFASSDSYKRGKTISRLYAGEISAHKGHFVEGKKLAEEGLEEFQKMNIEEGLNYRIAGRTFVLTGEHEKAMELFQKGLHFAERFPVEKAGIYVEMALLDLNRSNENSAGELVAKAAELYKACGASFRLKKLRSLFPASP